MISNNNNHNKNRRNVSVVVSSVVTMALLVGCVQSFTPSSLPSSSTTTTTLRRSPSFVVVQQQQNQQSKQHISSTALLMSTTLKPQDDPSLSYAERARVYRRDTFNYDLWVKHRSTDRFLGNLIDILKSGVIRSLLPEVGLMTTVAASICIFNNIFVNGYYDFDGTTFHPALTNFLPLLKLPGDFFTFMTPSLALLLVFKTNTSYRRWDEGRKNWGTMINSCRTIMREGAAWIHESTLTNDEKQRCMERLEQAVWLFPRSVTRHLLSAAEDQDDFATDCRTKLRPDLAEDMIVARHKPTRALYELSCAINELPITERRRVSIDEATTILCDAMGSSERIFTSPVPRFYTRHTARFLEVWLLMVPFALYEPFGTSWNHWAMIPATTVISIFLLGIEELGIQLEEPFSLLPQHGMTNNSIGKVATEAVEFRALDYQRANELYNLNKINGNSQ